MRRSTDRRVVRTRKAIREAFFKLMEDQDYHKITIASIAREADIDRKTFYLHYSSVSDLVDEVIRDEAQNIIASCRETLRSGGGEGLDVSRLFESISLAIAPDVSRGKRVLQHVSLQDVLDRLEASLVEELMEDNVLGLRRDDPYVPYIVSFFCAGLVAVYRRWLITDSEIALESLAGATSVCMFDGLNGMLSNVKQA